MAGMLVGTLYRATILPFFSIAGSVLLLCWTGHRGELRRFLFAAAFFVPHRFVFDKRLGYRQIQLSRGNIDGVYLYFDGQAQVDTIS